MKTSMILAVILAVGIGFAAGFASHSQLVGWGNGLNAGTQTESAPAAETPASATQTLKFDATVSSYSYSEVGVVRITKVDDQTYSLTAIRPGMCVISFGIEGQTDVPWNDRRGRYIVSVSPDKQLTIQETRYAAGGML